MGSDFFSRAAQLVNLNRWGDARPVINRGLKRVPKHPGLRMLKALLLMQDKRHSESREIFEALVAELPENAELHNNFGVLLREMGVLEKALSEFKLAVALNPGYREAQKSLATLALRLGDYDQTRCALASRAALIPDDAEANFLLAELLLGMGEWREGWRQFQWRPSHYEEVAKANRPHLIYEVSPLPRNIMGKRVALVPEQGVGDILFFLRFAPLLRARGARAVALSTGRMARMIRDSGVVDEVLVDQVEVSSDLPFPVYLGDLPFLVEAEDSIPPPLRFSALPERVEAARRELSALGPGPYIGVNWAAGTPGGDQVLHKAVTPEQLGELLRNLNATVVILQRNPGAGEIERFCAALGRPAQDLSAVQGDLEDLMAYLAAIDEIVGVSSTSVHLRVAMGLSARVLYVGHEWRWKYSGDTSPWFPDCAVYRMFPAAGERASGARLRADLEAALAERLVCRSPGLTADRGAPCPPA